MLNIKIQSIDYKLQENFIIIFISCNIYFNNIRNLGWVGSIQILEKCNSNPIQPKIKSIEPNPYNLGWVVWVVRVVGLFEHF